MPALNYGMRIRADPPMLSDITTMITTDVYRLHPCETERELSQAARLRYLAYSNVEAIDANAEEEFRDAYDVRPNSRTCIVYEDDTPVASVRACVYSRERDFLHIPAFEVYMEDIEREIGLDKTIVESNRFVIDPANVDSRQLFKVPFRFIILNILKFRSDYAIAAVRPRHAPLYRRLLNMEPISEPKRYPGINVDMIMMAGDCTTHVRSVMNREELFMVADEEVERYEFSASPMLLD